MLIGILSDTHGRAAATVAALARLGAAGAEFYIHCGDVGGQETLDLLAGLPLAFVWGNCDFQTPQLRQYAESLGMKCHGDFADLELDGRRIAVTHGDNPAILQRITSEKRHQYLLHGHTHVARDQVIDGLRWINPGAVHRSPRPSVAVLDTQSDSLRFIPLKDLKGA
jgi:putative phosphoesterase